jgi:transposase
VGVSAATALEYVRRAEVVGVTWPVPDAMDDAVLEDLLFPAPSEPRVTRPEPDWAVIHAEMKRKGVTLALLWEEYRVGRPDGYAPDPSGRRQALRRPRRHVRAGRIAVS